ncbi:cupin domain-containing protein [Bremerella sp. T1]|uniref:cupin domain-containing protein n=1 Tax=Bremerella sp. TYQ1 TaxID=3119568 RepID=UPI001CCDA1D6|nr:cupin domain-containing protein [Bremerella volcania]UBM35467.1 cupin domain-containing protein [Bremerella volcania]
MDLGNLFAEIPTDLPEEVFETLADGKGIRIERILSDGHASPKDFWYDQPQNEFVLLLQGSAVLQIQVDERVESVSLKPGDYINIAARQKHRVESTDDNRQTVWLAIHFDS